MSIRFVIGRAGTGKTYHCLESIREELRVSSIGEPRLVLLVPEQASLQMERSLLSGDIKATNRAEVLSFNRLAGRIMQQVTGQERVALSPLARAMVLRSIVSRLQPQLRYYRKVERLTGFLDQLGLTISEFIEEEILPGDLLTGAEGVKDNPNRAAKLRDLADVYQAYLEYLGNDRLDPSQYLRVARETLGNCDYLKNARIWVDGFAGYTRQELLLLSELARRAGSAEVTMLIDQASFDIAGSSEEIDPTGIFAKPARSCRSMIRLFRMSGLELAEPLVFSPETNPRFAASMELARLEEGLLAGFTAAGRGEGESGGGGDSTADVHLFELPDRRTEVDFAVSQVQNAVQKTQGRIRYRDVAIIVRDLDPYHDLLSAALAERNVPFFIDRRRSIAHHPVVEFLRSAAEVADSDFEIDRVRLLLKTGLLGITQERADELENYILAQGIASSALWKGGDWGKRKKKNSAENKRVLDQLQRINESRKTVWANLKEFIEFCRTPGSGAEWAKALGQLLEVNRTAAQVENWAKTAEDAGGLEQAAEHRQILDEIEAFLADLGSALADETFSTTDMLSVLEAGLSQMTLGLVPPTLDEVLVSSINRSRHPEIKMAIVLGFNDGVFPKLGSEDSILNDEDREFLMDREVELGSSRKQQILDEYLLAYVAATRPSEKLIFLYALSDCQGKELRKSSYVPLLERVLSGLKVRKLGDPYSTRAMWPVMTARDLSAGLVYEMANRKPLDKDNSPKRRAWNDLYSAARHRLGGEPSLKRAISALAFANHAMLKGESITSLFEGSYSASVSELETFAACPFQRFAKYGLRLKEREESKWQATEVGTLQHAILEDFLNQCIGGKVSFAEIGEEDLGERLQVIAEKHGASLEIDGGIKPRDIYTLKRSPEDLVPIVKEQQRIAAGGVFSPFATEKEFGFTGKRESLPPLEVDTPTGRKAYLRGLIDRVDIAEVGDETAGVVVDYKRTREKKLELVNVYHGLSLQLLGYLLAIRDGGKALTGKPVIPIGAFYVSLKRNMASVDHPEDVDKGKNRYGVSKPRGLINGAAMELLDRDSAEGGYSSLFSIYLKKDGSLGHIDRNDGADGNHFGLLLEHARMKIGTLVDGILDGDIAVAPYRLGDFSPCTWCELGSFCRFEYGDTSMRFLDKMSRSKVFKKLEGGE